MSYDASHYTYMIYIKFGIAVMQKSNISSRKHHRSSKISLQEEYLQKWVS